MTRRGTALSRAALAALASALVGLALVTACSDGAQRASSERAEPTSSIGSIANTVEEALSQARGIFTAAPPFVVHDIESAVYVDTTVGRARNP